jgi:hypothetical protein
MFWLEFLKCGHNHNKPITEYYKKLPKKCKKPFLRHLPKKVFHFSIEDVVSAINFTDVNKKAVMHQMRYVRCTNLLELVEFILAQREYRERTGKEKIDVYTEKRVRSIFEQMYRERYLPKTVPRISKSSQYVDYATFWIEDFEKKYGKLGCNLPEE